MKAYLASKGLVLDNLENEYDLNVTETVLEDYERYNERKQDYEKTVKQIFLETYINGENK